MKQIILVLLPVLLVRQFAPTAIAATRVTVAGDVPAPQTCEVADGNPACTSDVLEACGVKAPRGNALILRGSPLRPVSTDVISSGTERGSQLTDGDVVIFRATSQRIVGESNVVVKHSGRCDIVSFSQPTISLTSLTSDGMSGGATAVRITRTTWGSASFVEVTPETTLEHGDVVDYSATKAGIAVSENFQLADLRLSQPEFRQQSELDSITNEEQSGSECPMLSIIPTSSETTTSTQELKPISLTEPIQMELIPETPSTNDENRFRQASFPGPADDTAEQLATLPATAASESGMINILFACGLLLACGLIVVGWMKTQQEQQLELNVKPFAQRALDSETGLNQEAKHLGKTSAGLQFDQKTPIANATPLVTTNLMSGESDSEMNREEASTINVQPMDVENTHCMNSFEAERNHEARDRAKMSNEALVGVNEWFGGQWQSKGDFSPADMETFCTSDADTPVEESFAAVTEVQPEPSETPVAESACEVEAVTEGWGDLEDLIQNRLPLNLQTTDLPLRISLYGRPMGPRRLRVDQAHGQIAPPHIVAAMSRQRPSEMAAAQSGPVQSEITSRTNSRKEKNSSSGVDLGRLDRALNSLQENSES